MLQLKIAGQTIVEAMVQRLEVHQALGTHHRCTIDFTREDLAPAPLDAFVGHSMSVETAISGASPVTIFSGIVTAATLRHGLHGGRAIGLTGCSESIKLDSNRSEAYYVKKTLADICRELARKNGSAIVFEGEAGPPLNLVQNGETDFQYVLRLADDNECFVRPCAGGINVRKEFNRSGTELTWTTDLLSFHVNAELQPRMMRGAQFDPNEKRGVRLQQVSSEPTFSGAYSNLVDAVHDTSDALFAAQQSLEHFNGRTPTLDAYRNDLSKESKRRTASILTVEGESRNPRLAPGDFVSIKKTPEGEGEYGIVCVVHSYNALTGYINRFIGTPCTQYRAPKRPAPVTSTGLVTAIVVANNDPHRQNRLKLRYHWQDDGATSWIRTMMPYTGKDRGMMFLPEVGDEVVVAFENGDPERPIVIGSVWNGKDTAPRSPYRDSSDIDNNEIKRIVTKTGSRIEIVDTPGKETIEISTARRDCWIQLNSETKTIAFHSSSGNILLEAPEGEIRLSCKKLVTSASEDAFTSVHGNHVVNVQGNHVLEAGGIRETSHQAITISGATINEVAKGRLTLIGAPIDLNPMSSVVDVQAPISAPGANVSEWRPGNALEPGEPAVYETSISPNSASHTPPAAAENQLPAEKRSWVEIELIDEQGRPVPGEKYAIETPGGTRREGLLDSKGRARIDGIDPGTCKVSFPDRDAQNWKKD